MRAQTPSPDFGAQIKRDHVLWHGGAYCVVLEKPMVIPITSEIESDLST